MDEKEEVQTVQPPTSFVDMAEVIELLGQKDIQILGLRTQIKVLQRQVAELSPKGGEKKA